MVLPKRLARINRRVTNRITGSVATWLPGFGVVAHQGRRSGRTFRTPVNVFRSRGGYTVALTYGTDSDWVRNVLAAGGCELETRGRRVDLSHPRVVHDEARRGVPAAVRPILRAIGVDDFLLLDIAPQE